MYSEGDVGSVSQEVNILQTRSEVLEGAANSYSATPHAVKGWQTLSLVAAGGVNSNKFAENWQTVRVLHVRSD
jgi:hypothetical protein